MINNVNFSFTNLALIGLICFSMQMSIAQTFDDEEDENAVEVEVDNDIDQENATVIFDALGINNTPNPLNQTIVGNSVFLQQIGDLNNASVVVSANSSDINIIQNGNLNNAFLQYEVGTVITDIIQNGDGNVLSDIVNNPQQDVSLNVQQQGNYLTFERFGANELTKSLQFIQTEASPSIIVRSFN